MTGWKLVAAWASAVVFGLTLVGLGVFFVITGLDDAVLWASVIGVFATLIGVGLSGYGVLLARRAAGPGPAPAGPGGGGRQRVDAWRDAFTAVGDQRFGGATGSGASGSGAGSGRAGGVEQDVRAGRDAFAAGGDQHFGQRRPR
ncbi:hypothetical protein [Virgisporangium aurantiacum]|uniref:Uncharacterized protein n=1 Tax=Virgisporangium aurantiacum TaxID=175570 RepID=A0A8J3ZL25_9ACTN|nr:hypothetical protein [Virgisporangium aurantiacum]GIJ64758.1 hypothetical protein Vau01_122740 [Virgisporangium aurantiacum]